MAKITRVFFRYNNEDFCVDRPYVDDKNDQENTDYALTKFIDSMHDGLVVPALKLKEISDEDQKAKTDHVFVNLGLLAYVTILDVMLYTPQPVTPNEQSELFKVCISRW
jgi:hypothetical protein